MVKMFDVSVPMQIKFLALCVVVALLPRAALACGPDSDCKIGDRIYRIAMPEGYDGVTPVGAVVWAHGYRGTAAGAMRNKSLRKMISDEGMAFIATKSGDDDWNIPNAPRNMDSTGAEEFAYFDAVIADAAERFAIDTDRLVSTGFSAGGMVVWNLACARSDTFAGFIPMSGTFWKAPPQTCEKPVASIVHIHGDDDSTVPLLGRPIGPTRQGEVPAALEMYNNFGDFGGITPSRSADLSCETRLNDGGEILEFCLFPGGHSFRTEHLLYGLKELRKAGQL
jgi:polyhydroxybutyrate depolymerase